MTLTEASAVAGVCTRTLRQAAKSGTLRTTVGLRGYQEVDWLFPVGLLLIVVVFMLVHDGSMMRVQLQKEERVLR